LAGILGYNNIMNMVKVNLSKIYFWSLALIAFFLPLIFGSHTNELYEFPKTYFVYFLGGSLITAFVVEHIFRDIKLPKVPLYIKLYILSYVISSLFSMHHHTSFWGYYTRFNDCLMSTLVMFGLYVVAKSKLDREEFEKLFKIIVFSVIPVSILGISQHTSMTRVYSTFGQPNWLAQFLTITLPLANYLFFVGPATWLWFGISVLGFACLWFTYSMSGLLGYGISFVVLLYIYKNDWFPNRTNLYKLIALIVTLELIAVTNLGVFQLRLQDTTNDIRNMVTVSPKVYAAETRDINSIATQRNLSDPGFIRGGLWLGTAKLMTSNLKIFLIGTGPETFPYAFQKFRPRELNYSSEWNFVFNKPHNYFLEVASEQGIAGLGIYIYLYWLLLKKLDKKYLPCFIGFIVTNIFGWPTATTTFIFWMYLASIEIKHAKNN
jgi:hypothetical protein